MSHEVKCLMPAKVMGVHVKPGDSVAANTVVVTLESMKMEMPVEAEVAGTVTSVSAVEGDTLPKGHVLVVID